MVFSSRGDITQTSISESFEQLGLWCFWYYPSDPLGTASHHYLPAEPLGEKDKNSKAEVKNYNAIMSQNVLS